MWPTLWRTGHESHLVDGHARSPAAVRAVWEWDSIDRGLVGNHLVLGRRREHVLHSQLPRQQLGEDREVVLPWARGAENKRTRLVASMLLQRVILQLLALVDFVIAVSEGYLVGEVGGLAVAQRDGDAALAGVDDAHVVRDEEHAALEEVGLDERQVLEVLQRYVSRQQLPLLFVGPVAVDQLLGVSQEVKVVILVHLHINEMKFK